MKINPPKEPAQEKKEQDVDEARRNQLSKANGKSADANAFNSMSVKSGYIKRAYKQGGMKAAIDACIPEGDFDFTSDPAVQSFFKSRFPNGIKSAGPGEDPDPLQMQDILKLLELINKSAIDQRGKPLTTGEKAALKLALGLRPTHHDLGVLLGVSDGSVHGIEHDASDKMASFKKGWVKCVGTGWMDEEEWDTANWALDQWSAAGGFSTGQKIEDYFPDGKKFKPVPADYKSPIPYPNE